MKSHHYPVLYEVQTRSLLYALSKKLKREATLDDVPDSLIKEWKAKGFEWIWLLGVWQTGQAGKKISRIQSQWVEEFRRALPDLEEHDITGSCYSIKDYKAHADLGGDIALASFRKRLHKKGLKLMLDFVPNHTALDHRWVRQHPEYYLRGTADDLKAEPDNYIEIQAGKSNMVFAYGRDPHYPGWPDTLQLDYSNPDLQKAMKEELLALASRCDGLRCDMAMLLLPDVYEKTWRRPVRPFWPVAIERVRDKYPDFLFLAEVYWDLEWEMQQLGFDYCYDKRMYDRLLHPYAPAIMDHLRADTVFQNRLMRFMENHDEPRAAAVFPEGMHQAAAIINYFSPGMKMFHQGQQKGYMTRIPVHLRRGPEEKENPDIAKMYEKLLGLLREKTFRDGNWKYLDCRRAWEDDNSFHNMIAYCWQHPEHTRYLVTVNYSPGPSKCFVGMPFPEMMGSTIIFKDQLSDHVYDRLGNELISKGLYLDLPAWGTHIFKVEWAD